MKISRTILLASAAVAGAAGLTLLFLPDDALRVLGAPGAAAPASAVAQLYGAALFGVAMQNWAARGTKVGGIYGRPLALANLVQWGAGAAIWAHLWRAAQHAPIVEAGMAAWLACATAFAYLMFLHDPLG